MPSRKEVRLGSPLREGSYLQFLEGRPRRKEVRLSSPLREGSYLVLPGGGSLFPGVQFPDGGGSSELQPPLDEACNVGWPLLPSFLSPVGPTGDVDSWGNRESGEAGGAPLVLGWGLP